MASWKSTFIALSFGAVARLSAAQSEGNSSYPDSTLYLCTTLKTPIQLCAKTPFITVAFAALRNARDIVSNQTIVAGLNESLVMSGRGEASTEKMKF